MKQKYLTSPYLLPSLSAFLLVFLLAILSNHSNINYDNKRIIEVSLLLFILIFFAFSKNNLFFFLNKKNKITVIILFFLGTLSSINSQAPTYAFIELITFLSLLIVMFYIFITWAYKRCYFFYAILILAISFLFLEIKFYAYYLAFIFSNNEFSIHDFFPSFANARFFNQYQIWTLPFLSLLCLNQSLFNRIHKKIFLFVAISWWLMFFTTGSRGAIVGVSIASLITLFFFRDKASYFLKTTLLLALSGFVLYQFLFHLLPYLLYQDSDVLMKSLEIRTNHTARLTLWLKALYFIKDNPFLGIGPMHYAWHESIGSEGIGRLNHPHNSLLQWGAEWGLISLSLLMYLFFQGCKSWFNKFNYNTLESYDSTHRQLIIALSFSSSSAAIYSLFSGIIVMPMSHLMGVLVFSMMLGIYNANKTHLKHDGFAYNLVFIPVALFYFYLLIPDILEIVLSQKDTYEIRSTAPRFWVDGNIKKQ